MRKFAFLLAIVAVFAMSASAFAVDNVDTITDAASPLNIGKITLGSGSDNFVGMKANAYYLKGYAASLDLAMKIKLDGTSNTIVSADLVTDAAGATLVNAAKTATDYHTAGVDVNFQVGGWAAIPETFQLAYIGDWGTTGAVRPTGATVKSGDITITTKSLDICLSSDGAAKDSVVLYIGEATDMALSVDGAGMLADITDLTTDIAIGAKVAGTSGVITSDDVTKAANAINGVTIDVDDTKKNITLTGTPNGEFEGTLVVYVAAGDKAKLKVTDGSDSTATLATPTSDDDAGDPEAYILATMDVEIKKTDKQMVQDAITNASTAVKAELAKLTGGPVALVMNTAGDAIVSVDVQELAFDYTDTAGDAITITVVSLDMKSTTTSVDTVAAFTGNMAALSADVTSDDHVAYIVPEPADDGISSVITYTISPSIFAKDSPIPVTTSSVHAAAPAGFHDVPVDYTITFPKAVGLDPMTVTYTTYAKDASSSSSGACSMGFGLAAIAGLAALALRKRSK